MSLPSVLPESFYTRSVLEAAPGLLGCRLVRQLNGTRLAGIITETEAYNGEADRACHARSGPTKRNNVMYGPPGRAYIYFTYGMHWMLNCITQPEGQPTAVLIRAVLPTEGLDVIAANRAGRPPAQWSDGPAKLCQAFAIDGSLNGAALTSPCAGLWIETSTPIRPEWIETGPRVGINYAGEPWVSMPWRYQVHLPLNWLEPQPD